MIGGWFSGYNSGYFGYSASEIWIYIGSGGVVFSGTGNGHISYYFRRPVRVIFNSPNELRIDNNENQARLD